MVIAYLTTGLIATWNTGPITLATTTDLRATLTTGGTKLPTTISRNHGSSARETILIRRCMATIATRPKSTPHMVTSSRMIQ